MKTKRFNYGAKTTTTLPNRNAMNALQKSPMSLNDYAKATPLQPAMTGDVNTPAPTSLLAQYPTPKI